MRKLSLHSIRDLVVYAIKNNIIQIQMPAQIRSGARNHRRLDRLGSKAAAFRGCGKVRFAAL